MLVREAQPIVGGYTPDGNPAAGLRETCPIGDFLARKGGTVCAECYADNRGRYGFQSVRDAQKRRLQIVEDAIADGTQSVWIEAMITMVARNEHFRWHDSGDVFSQEYLDMILAVVEATPGTSHWLPTKEIGLMAKNRARIEALPNLVVRVSEFLIGISGRKSRGFHSSSVGARG